MRRFLLLLILLTLAIPPTSCATLPPTSPLETPEQLKQLPIYQEADYLALIRVDFTRNGKEYLGELSGFLIENENDGKLYVVTAGHIKDTDDQITGIVVFFKNNPERSYNAELLGYDSAYDLAALKVTDPDFKFEGKLATLGNSSLVRIDNKVYSLGNPNGRYWFITSGYVDDPHNARNYQPLSTDLIEHSATSGYGSSGGPLLNTNGEVIGMNVAVKIHKDRIFSNKVLAIPVNSIKKRLSAVINGYQK